MQNFLKYFSSFCVVFMVSGLGMSSHLMFSRDTKNVDVSQLASIEKNTWGELSRSESKLKELLDGGVRAVFAMSGDGDNKIEGFIFYTILNVKDPNHKFRRVHRLALIALSVNGPFDRSQEIAVDLVNQASCLLYTSPSPRDKRQSRMPSSA